MMKRKIALVCGRWKPPLPSSIISYAELTVSQRSSTSGSKEGDFCKEGDLCINSMYS